MHLRRPLARRTRTLAPALLCAALLLGPAAPAQNDGDFEKASHTKVGDPMPAVTVQEISGQTFSLASEKGKVVVVNFWATWCGPCQVEMPRLEKEIWQKYKPLPGFAMVAIAREQTREVVADFQRKHPGYTFPLAFDPDRAVYARFADIGIPRTYVVDRRGTILFQSVGYVPEDIPNLDHAIQQALHEN